MSVFYLQNRYLEGFDPSRYRPDRALLAEYRGFEDSRYGYPPIKTNSLALILMLRQTVLARNLQKAKVSAPNLQKRVF